MIVHPTEKVTRKNIEPVEGVVIHYTASPGPGPQPARMFRWLDARKRKSSTHYIILRDGEVIQAAGHDVRTWHAGGSRWRGRGSVNKRSLGIDLENVGRLYPREDGSFRDSYGGTYNGPRPVKKGKTYWEPYTDEQMLALAKLVGDLVEDIPVLADPTRWVGHEHIKKSKSDPGPAFPWDRLRGWVEGWC